MRFLPGLLILLLAVGLSATTKPPVSHASPNIILITLDTTRADRMGFLGSERRLTPNLDALAKQSAVFIHAYSQVPLTTPSHAAILTGTYPQFNQVRQLEAPLNPKLPYLPDLLRRGGYKTAAILGSIVFAPADNAPGFDRGFSTYDADFHLQTAGEDRYRNAERRAEVVVDHALRWLSQRPPGPFFLWLHFYDPHAPYDPPEPYKNKYSGAPYDGEIAYMDAQVGRFFANLKEKKLYDGAVIAVMADHGEAFGEHGEQYHGVFVYDETIRVPLVIKLPGERFGGTRVGPRVGLVDVAPTLLQEAGVAPPATMQGKSLLPLMEASDEKSWGNRKIYSESEYAKVAFNWSPLFAWRADKYLYVAAPERELYDQEADPAATRNLVSARKAVADTLLSQLSAFQKGTSSRGDINPGVGKHGAESLAALGYVASTEVSTWSLDDVGGVDPKQKIEVANLLHKGLLDSSESDLGQAITELERVIQGEPNTRMAYLELGRCYRRSKDFQKALPMFRKAAESMPGVGAAQFELARTLVETGKWDEAAPLFERALADNPDEAEWHFDLAVVYERTRRLPEATEQFRATLKLNPSHFRANLLLGRLLGMKGAAREALPFLQKAATLDPNSADAHTYLANVYAMLQQPARARQEREAAERLQAVPAK